MDPVPGTIVAGKFRLDRPLARGGMGSVWVAFNTQLEVPVALKFMAPALVGSAELVTRFEREAKAAAQLRNPHVVQIFEHGVDRGTPFMAMELLEGEDLGARLKKKGRLSIAETARILGDVCKALRKAHDSGLVHRDLKPANIFLRAHEEYEVVKVLDFGIAKSLADTQGEVTQTGAIVGSPHYMAPEQARRMNRQVDHRSDLWSLGVIAFRCITGRLPFPGDDLIDVLVRVCTEAAPAASSVARDLGPDVDRFFARALAREPGARFQSAKEMAEALRQLSGTEGVPALDRSWSDVQAPLSRPSGPNTAGPPGPQLRAAPDALARSGEMPGRWVPPSRGSQPAAPRDPVPARIGPSDEDNEENVVTVPLQSARAQQQLAAKRWMPDKRPLLATLPLNDQIPRPPEPPAPGAARPLPPPRYDPSPAQAAPSNAAPTSTLRSATHVRMSFVETDPVVSSPPPPRSLLPAPPLSDGTLTNSGAELGPRWPAPKRNRPWVVMAAVSAATVVVGIVAMAVWLGHVGEGAANSPASDGTGTTGATQDTTPAATPEPSAEAPGATGSSATPEPSAELPAATGTASEPVPGRAAASATAASATQAASNKRSPEDEEALRALGQTPTAGSKAKAPTPPGGKTKGGLLVGPKF